MNPVLLILAMFVATYSTRIAGFAARGRSLPDVVERFLAGVPIAAFAALIVTGIDPGSSGSDTRILAAIPAAVIAWRWKRLWLTLMTGMIFYWIANYVL